MRMKLWIGILTIVIVVLCSTFVLADNVGIDTTVPNTAPSVDIELIPDDDPTTPGVQVITNKTVTITATVVDMNGYDDIISVIANITGPSVVEDSPVSLSFDGVVNVTTAVYKGTFNMSNHAEGDYKVDVTATDKGGLTGVGSKNFTYLYGVVVTTYDFKTGAGIDKWAYRYQHNTKPPATNDVPNMEFKRRHYRLISRDDRIMKIDFTRSNDYYAIHRFKFNIAEPEGSITKLDILWDGAGYMRWGTRGATLYIWNFETGMYEQLDRDTATFLTLEGTISDNIEDYMDDDGSAIIIAEQNSAQWRFWRWTFRSQLGTDYVKVDVTYIPKPYLTILDILPDATEVNPGDDITFAIDVRNDGASGYGYVGGAAIYPDGTYCNTEWEKSDYLNTGETYTAHLDWTVPEEAPLGWYGFVSATWDACWTGCEAEPCYLDGCCEGEQERYGEANVFEVVNKFV